MKKVVGAIKNNIFKKDMKLWILKLLHKGRKEELSVQCVLAENWNLEVDWYTGRFDIVAQVSNMP